MKEVKNTKSIHYPYSIDDYIEKEMFKVKCGDFEDWYNNLPTIFQEAHKRVFEKLQNKYEK